LNLAGLEEVVKQYSDQLCTEAYNRGQEKKRKTWIYVQKTFFAPACHQVMMFFWAWSGCDRRVWSDVDKHLVCVLHRRYASAYATAYLQPMCLPFKRLRDLRSIAAPRKECAGPAVQKSAHTKAISPQSQEHCHFITVTGT
jgi:hypothetical protein